VVVGPTHPICSMIYGSTGATHFDQLAKILTGYEIIGARSSGIFMGILFIALEGGGLLLCKRIWKSKRRAQGQARQSKRLWNS
jgi:hypothetical protein